MKKIKFLSGALIVTLAFLLGGCYTQIATQGNSPDNSGYGYGNQNNYDNQNQYPPGLNK